MRNLTACAAVATLLIPAAAVWSAPAQTPVPAAATAQELTLGTATGQLVVGDQTFPLTHAYVLAVDDVEQERSSGPQKSISILLSDVPVGQDRRHEYFHLSIAAREKQLHAVLLNYDPKTKSLYNVSVFAIRKGARELPQNISLSGSEGNYPLENFSVAEGVASGTARMTTPGEIMNLDPDNPESKPRAYSYTVTFRAPLENTPPVTATLVGKEAKASPQVALATRFFAACHAGNLAQVRLMTILTPEMEKMIKEQGVAKTKQMLKQFIPAPAVFAKMKKKVVVRGDKATIIVGDTKSPEGELRLIAIRTGGKWVVLQ